MIAFLSPYLMPECQIYAQIRPIHPCSKIWPEPAKVPAQILKAHTSLHN